ncbi:MAG: cytochrome d ubiquinol oxidase subunit II [Verrucomicrobia bacterium]|nr:cytochrome d ubiquinol oxidase subunit II [Verrucomicrobiota bacterium]
MPLEILQLAWYTVVVIAIIFYVILDGFDLGVGSLQLFIKGDTERRICLNSIGPFWDGNEVWLIAIGGGLFVGFPDVYASVFSGFYVLLMIYLAGIIFRACAIEFRSKHTSNLWRKTWDTVFWFSSLTITFGSGILLGSFVQGVPLNASREIYLSFWSLFTRYTVGMGLMAVFLFAMHGNHFLLLKTEGELQARIYKLFPWTTALFLITFTIMTIWTWSLFPYMGALFIEMPLFWFLPGLLIGAFCAKIWASIKGRYGLSFFFSMLTISLLFLLFVAGTFPNMVISSIDRDLYSLTLYNSSSTATTLKVALMIAFIGVPLVLLYGYILYATFRGKTRLHDHSY